jgi:hypothetical protein
MVAVIRFSGAACRRRSILAKRTHVAKTQQWPIGRAAGM